MCLMAGHTVSEGKSHEKCPFISRNNMIQDEIEGGLRMIKIETFIKALKITWLGRFLINTQIPMWNSLSNINFVSYLCE